MGEGVFSVLFLSSLLPPVSPSQPLPLLITPSSPFSFPISPLVPVLFPFLPQTSHSSSLSLFFSLSSPPLSSLPTSLPFSFFLLLPPSLSPPSSSPLLLHGCTDSTRHLRKETGTTSQMTAPTKRKVCGVWRRQQGGVRFQRPPRRSLHRAPQPSRQGSTVPSS